MILDTAAKKKQIEAQISNLQARLKLLMEIEQEDTAKPYQGSILGPVALAAEGTVTEVPSRGMSKAILAAIPTDSEITSEALFNVIQKTYPETSRQAVVVAVRRWEAKGMVKVDGDKSSGLRFRRLNR